MTLNDYLSKNPISDFAKAIGIKNLDQIRQWQHGYAKRKPSPANCIAIERATSGAVTRKELRPKDYWLIWPDLPRTQRKTAQ
jgi:DNA-binding transcriptional regulator YdaS (Cro superfamily)